MRTAEGERGDGDIKLWASERESRDPVEEDNRETEGASHWLLNQRTEELQHRRAPSRPGRPVSAELQEFTSSPGCSDAQVYTRPL